MSSIYQGFQCSIFPCLSIYYTFVVIWCRNTIVSWNWPQFSHVPFETDRQPWNPIKKSPFCLSFIFNLFCHSIFGLLKLLPNMTVDMYGPRCDSILSVLNFRSVVQKWYELKVWEILVKRSESFTLMTLLLVCLYLLIMKLPPWWNTLTNTIVRFYFYRVF